MNVTDSIIPDISQRLKAKQKQDSLLEADSKIRGMNLEKDGYTNGRIDTNDATVYGNEERISGLYPILSVRRLLRDVL